MTIFHIRKRISALFNAPPVSPTAQINTARPFVESSQHIAQPTLLAMQRSNTPVPELPDDVLHKITVLANDIPTLKNVSIASKACRAIALEIRHQQPYSLDDLAHLRHANATQQHVHTLYIDPVLDRASLNKLKDWDLNSLKHLELGTQVSRYIKYKKLSLALPNTLTERTWGVFSSEIFNTYPQLQKIETLVLKDLTELDERDNFSALPKCNNLRTMTWGLTRGELTGEKLDHLSQLPNLKKLAFHNLPRIKEEHYNKFTQFKQLKTLTISPSFSTPHHIFRGFSLCPQLEYFELNDAIETHVLEGLKHLISTCKTLKTVKCDRLWISRENADTLHNLATQHNVELHIGRSSAYDTAG